MSQNVYNVRKMEYDVASEARMAYNHAAPPVDQLKLYKALLRLFALAMCIITYKAECTVESQRTSLHIYVHTKSLSKVSSYYSLGY